MTFKCEAGGVTEENALFWTAEEAAIYLRTSADTIRRLLRNKKLEGFRIGGQWRVAVEAIKILSALKVRAAAPPGSMTHGVTMDDFFSS
jgi:excisionase family DNA binding protein